MKKKLILLGAILLMCCPFAYGCNNDDSSESNTTPYSQTGTSWDNTINKVYDMALDTETYPYSQEIYINVKDTDKIVDYTIIVADETTPEQAVQYATDLIKAFNDTAASKDDSIAKSSDGYYGGVFDEYTVIMTIATEESVLNESDWLVCQTVKPGEHTPMKAGGFQGNAE